MLKRNFVLLCLLLCGCRGSTGVLEADQNHFKWYVDEFFSGSSESSRDFLLVYNQADLHCKSFRKRAVFAIDPIENGLFKYFNYLCIPEAEFQCKFQLMSPCIADERSKISILPMEDAKKTCINLGFKEGSEKFGNCVLQISK